MADVLCRKCGWPITESHRFGSEESGWEHLPRCPDLPPIDLTGFEPPFGCGEYSWGRPVTFGEAMDDVSGLVPPVDPSDQWQEHAYHAEILSWHYHDYMGSHVFVQVWDYSQQRSPHQTWRFYLLVHEPFYTYETFDGVRAIVATNWAWRVQVAYEDHWRDGTPAAAGVGADVDAWRTERIKQRPV
jgi:hypothetical protein